MALQLPRLRRDLAFIAVGSVAGLGLSIALAAHATANTRAHGAGADHPAAPAASASSRPRATHDHTADHLQALRQHDLEPTDGAWAPHASQVLGGDLQTIAAAASFQVQSVDCRTTSCVATLRWPTFEAARQGYPAIGALMLHMACRREVTIPDPADPAAPYDATAIFDCAPDRESPH